MKNKQAIPTKFYLRRIPLGLWSFLYAYESRGHNVSGTVHAFTRGSAKKAVLKLYPEAEFMR